MRSIVFLALFLGMTTMGCADTSVQGDGEECFSSSECAEGLLCDFGATPSVCRAQQTGGGPVPVADAAPSTPVDGAPVLRPDAAPVIPDAAPIIPDAAPVVDAPIAVDAAVDAAAGGAGQD